MTKKGEQIQDKILRILDRNPAGLRIGQLQKILKVSRNSVYRYLEKKIYPGMAYNKETETYEPQAPHEALNLTEEEYNRVVAARTPRARECP